jgi:hypothetical protein
MIPNIFHFVFGMVKEVSTKPFSLSHYLAIKSAVVVNEPAEILFHCHYEPEGEWWEKAKPLLTLNKVEAPESFMGRPLYHAAHKTDVIRLQALYRYGGIYLDLDTICVKPLTGLLSHCFVMGQELNLPYSPKNKRQEIKLAIRKKLGLANKLLFPKPGLCNAVLLAEKNSDFVRTWMEEYKTFRSKGRDKYWNEHSGRVPLKLASHYPHLVTLLSPYAFHYPLYNAAGMKSMFEEVTEFPESYLHHLWESFSWEPYLKNITVKEIFEKDTTYNLIARRFL